MESNGTASLHLAVNDKIFRQFSDAIAAVAVCTMLPILSTIAVALRILAQKGLKKVPLGADDYFIIAGLVFASANCGQAIWGAVRGGLGWPVEYLIIYGRITIYSKV
ncbi:hypothetical protein HYALB_00004106 [Hymenoscyphus albidus]|uniref:Uncharacterized protein n=1 Tax=Hymenoscyphus albidus TaxID=595503 RepID=A0A9N9LZ10_9HELO|nr:hypothetical protein HYALB_00004106 [Hymenoscyphus albidus]